MNRSILAIVSTLLGLAWSIGALAQAPIKTDTPALVQSGSSGRQLSLSVKPWKGDFDGMLERRLIRVYLPYSRSLFFIDKGRQRGISADVIHEFERWLNKKYAKTLGKRPLTLLRIIATRDKMVGDLNEGRADVAIGGIKVLDELTKSVDFVAPDDKVTTTEVLVTGPASPTIASIDELSGKTVHVREYSGYYLSLEALNERFRQAGKPEVKLVFVPNALEDEDMLEMLNAGLLESIVVDDWKATMWAQVLTKVQVHENIQLRPRTKIGWAIRKDSPKLAAELNEFYAYYAKTTGGVPALQRQYMRTIKVLHDATAGDDRKRFEELKAYFQKYGKLYGFDYLLLEAQGYQESTLNQEVKSPVGAIGIMQVMPATGEGLKVGDVHQTEPNIHAGTKYMDQLMTNYFSDAKFDEQNRTLFAFASYNAGPGNISKMRKEAAKRGLDPDQWFNNVEIVTAEKIGIETTTYVRNIFKYYAAYSLAIEAQENTGKLKEQVAPARN